MIVLLVHRNKIGEGRFYLESITIQTADGLNVYLGGGEKSHVGTIVVSQPRPSLKGDGTQSVTSSVINIVGHKDDEIAKPLAEKLCRIINQTVVVTAGVHVEEATKNDIEQLLRLAEELTEEIIVAHQEGRLSNYDRH